MLESHACTTRNQRENLDSTMVVTLCAAEGGTGSVGLHKTRGEDKVESVYEIQEVVSVYNCRETKGVKAKEGVCV